MMKVTVGGLGYVAVVRAACIGSRSRGLWQLTLARPKPARPAFSCSQNAAAADVISVRYLPTLVLSLVPLALACALECGQVGVPGVVSGAQASVGSGLGVPAR